MPKKYRAYGLNVLSYVPMPELTPAEFEEPHLTVRPGALTQPAPEMLPEGEGCWLATEDDAHYFWSTVGGLHIHKGREIIYDPDLSTTPTSLRLAILGPAIATALHQRGFLVLHASAFLTEMGAVAFVGPSGSGKTTALSALLAMGYQPITDDLLVVLPDEEPAPVVVPGPSQIKLWPEVVLAQGRDPSSLPRLGPGYIKLVDRIERPSLPEQIPLRGIYLVVPDKDLRIKSISPPDALMALMTHSYCSEVLRFVGERTNFSQCATVVRQVAVRQLHRGRSLTQISELAASVEKDLA